MPAARFHAVNPYVLRAILKLESGLNPGTTVSLNTNGTADVDFCQFNSMHFKRLAGHNIASHHCSNPASVPMWLHGIWQRSFATRQHLVCLWPIVLKNSP